MSARDQEKADEVPISSLIDVVFLLIMFFVVTANMEQEGVDNNVKLAIANNMKKVEEMPEKRVVINVRYYKDESRYEYTVNGAPTGIEGVYNNLLGAHNAMGEDVHVIIRTDQEAPFAAVDEVMQQVGKAGLSRIKISAEVQE